MLDMKQNTVTANRKIKIATMRDDALGPLKLLPGTWANITPDQRDGSNFKGAGTLEGQGQSPFDGRGWNLIALPFAEPNQFRNYRLLFNQYNEVLKFTKVDESVPNRGITGPQPADQADQLVAALDYEQTVAQIAAKDIGESDVAGPPELPIHHEPGLFLHMKEQNIEGINIGRLATIPHGNSATALGTAREFDGPPTIEDLSAFPIGVLDGDIVQAVEEATQENAYLFPYHAFDKEQFKGVLEAQPFPGFGPRNANQLLQLGMPTNVLRTTELAMDTTVLEAGIVNIPFIERQADAAEMRSTFWIMELDEPGLNGKNKLVMAYSQFIFLDFFDRRDNVEGLIRWPHISINMMEKIEEPPEVETEEMIIAYAKT
ncbi:MAG: heme-binding protein [Paracoccaceae bacterium]